MELWIGAINLGFLYAFMAMGVFITFRIHNFPDITVDGSFVTGAAVTAVLMIAGVNPWAAIGLAFIAGAVAGAFTAFIHTRFNVNGLLAGILVMTGLYSVNLHIMGRSNIPLMEATGIITYLKAVNPGLPYEVWLCIVFCAVMLCFWALVSFFFRTNFGIAMRATGNN
ncbi:MAG: ABC transporter permease, partial [Deltaproteobacteria bacterium]|nr:ABC transporter permease [Deltaproteobacteria bacterium]